MIRPLSCVLASANLGDLIGGMTGKLIEHVILVF